MSAYIVDKRHIDYLVAAALYYGEKRRGPLMFGKVPITKDNADFVGQRLWEENFKSVNHRYTENTLVEEYVFQRWNTEKITPAQVVMSVHCYEYQSCEHEGWETSHAAEFCNRLIRVMARCLPETEKAEWGAPKEDKPEPQPEAAPAEEESPFGEVIHSYTRAQALEDGVLVDVTETAKEAGFKVPVAVTQAVFAEYITPDPRATGQSVAGRLWDTVFMAYLVARHSGHDLTRYFKVKYIMKKAQPRVKTLKMVSGPGDNGEHVITIMKRDED